MDERELKQIKIIYDWKELKYPENLEKKDFKDVLFILFEKYIRNDYDKLDLVDYLDVEIDRSITSDDYDEMYAMIPEMYKEFEELEKQKTYNLMVKNAPARVWQILNDIEKDLFSIREECKLESPCAELADDFESLNVNMMVLKAKIQKMILEE